MTHASYSAVKQAIDASSLGDKEAAFKGYLAAVDGKSNATARDIAKDILGEPVFWDWDRESSSRLFMAIVYLTSFRSSQDP